MQSNTQSIEEKTTGARDVSIEYAHIYTNHEIGQEHHSSLVLLKSTQEDFVAQDLRTSRMIMVDDYTFPNPVFDYESFAGWLGEHGCSPDLIIRESQLMPWCDVVIRLIDRPKLRTELIRYISTKRYPCSLFVVAWYLIRLGCIPHPLVSQQVTAHKLLNILPEKYRPFEDRALEIIAETPFRDKLADISHRYYES